MVKHFGNTCFALHAIWFDILYDHAQKNIYGINSKNWDRQAWAKSVDPESGIWSGSTLFATHAVFLGTPIGSKMDVEFLGQVW